jgi:hypothetical protein
LGKPAVAAIEQTLTIEALLLLRIDGRAARETRANPKTLILKIFSQFVSGSVSIVTIDYSDLEVSEQIVAYLRLPLQFGLFYWAWAIAKDIKKHLAKVEIN